MSEKNTFDNLDTQVKNALNSTRDLIEEHDVRYFAGYDMLVRARTELERTRKLRVKQGLSDD